MAFTHAHAQTHTRREESGWRDERTAIFSVVAHINAHRKHFYWRAAAEEMVESGRVCRGVAPRRAAAAVMCLQRRKRRRSVCWTRNTQPSSRPSETEAMFREVCEGGAPPHILHLKRPPARQRSSDCLPRSTTDCTVAHRKPWKHGKKSPRSVI